MLGRKIAVTRQHAFVGYKARKNLRVPLSSQCSTSQPGESSEPTEKRFVVSSHTTEEEWRKLDKKVNKYPGQRTFTAIGMGGESFRRSMLEAVEGICGPVHLECVSQRLSTQGKYLSVRIGPVWVTSADQVVAVYEKMRADERLKFFL